MIINKTEEKKKNLVTFLEGILTYSLTNLV